MGMDDGTRSATANSAVPVGIKNKHGDLWPPDVTSIMSTTTSTTDTSSKCDDVPSLRTSDFPGGTRETFQSMPSDVSSSNRGSISSSTTNSPGQPRKYTRSFSRRISNLSKVDGTALPLSPEIELRKKENLSDKLQLLPCGNLRFEKLERLGVVGREEETKVLKGVFKRVAKRGVRGSDGGNSRGSFGEGIGSLVGNPDGADLGNDGNRCEQPSCTKNGTKGEIGPDSINTNSPSNPNNSTPKELILISGISGSGKTCLATSFVPLVSRLGGIFVQGKYDLCFQEQQPYHGILMACAAICGKILLLKQEYDHQNKDHSKGQPSKFEQIRDLLIQELGDELPILVNLLQPLADIVGEKPSSNILGGGLTFGVEHQLGSEAISLNMEQTKEQFHYVFRKFIRILTSNPLSHSLVGKFIVIMLDDLQWADDASLELIDLLLTDRESENLVIVGCYRSEEVEGIENSDCMLRRSIDNWKEKTNVDSDTGRWNVNLTNIRVLNLPVESVNQILMELLSIDRPTQSLSLAELCHKRSFGNPFHLITFLRMLEDTELLKFNIGSFSWRWDLELIKQKTCAEENVVGLLRTSLKEINEDLKWVLIVAACLGSSFDVETLFLVWSELRCKSVGILNGESCNDASCGNDVRGSRYQLELLLEQAVNGHYLEQDGNHSDASEKINSFRWVHDKVIEAVMELANKIHPGLQFRIGLILLENLPEDGLDNFVFVIANLLCCESSSKLDRKTRDKIVQICIHSAVKAISCSAFKSASRYIRQGVQLFQTSDVAFEENYELSLELWTLGTEVEGSLGNEESMQQYFDTVDRHAKTSLDKLRCYDVLISCLANTDTKRSCSMCLDTLREFGCDLPRNSLAQASKAVMALQRTKKMDPQILHDIPLMTNEKVKASMNLLNHLCANAMLLGNSFLLILACCEMYERTFKYGVSPLSSSALSFLGAIRCATSDFLTGRDLCDHALKLSPKFHIKSVQARTQMVSYYMVKPWTMPMRNCQKFLIEGYTIGLEGGDTENGCWGIAMYIFQCFCSGVRLQSILADISNYLPQIEEFGRMEQALHVKIHQHAILNLVGLSKSPDPTHIYLEDIMDDFRKSTTKIPPLLRNLYESTLCSIFGNHERGAKLAQRGDEFFKVTAGHSPAMIDTFQRGVSLFDMARKTKKRKYKKAAKKVRSTIAKWVKANNPNVVHCAKLLDAEYFALCGDQGRAKQAYESSIMLSVRSGMIHDAALASERYGEYLSKEIRNEERALGYFKRAIQYYSEWGAVAKVHQLNQKYSRL